MTCTLPYGLMATIITEPLSNPKCPRTTECACTYVVQLSLEAVHAPVQSRNIRAVCTCESTLP